MMMRILADSGSNHHQCQHRNASIGENVLEKADKLDVWRMILVVSTVHVTVRRMLLVVSTVHVTVWRMLLVVSTRHGVKYICI